VTLAIERERGLLELKRALPMPPAAYLGAKLGMAMLFAGIVSMLLIVLAATAGEVVLQTAQWVALFLLAIFGALPFCGLGLLIGTLVKGQAAAAVINLIYLPMSFLSGLFFPMSVLPHSFVQLAPLWPSYHLAQVALQIVGEGGSGRVLSHLAAVIAEAAVFFTLAQRRLGRVR
jgi:ABC-2 type transport system permease protein